MIRCRRLICTLVLLGAAALQARAEPALWRLSDADSDIYLFGTVHVLPPGLAWRTPAIDAAFEDADTVWFEAPANDPSAQIQMLMLIGQLGLNPQGQTLSSQISPQALEALGAFAQTAGISVAELEPLRPWLAAITLTAAYIQSQGYDPESGVESLLWPIASASGKHLEYFETIEQQLRFFADLPAAVEVELFEQTVLEYEGASDELGHLVSAWADGDLETIDELVNGELRRQAPAVYDVVITERNEAWVRKIRSLVEGSGSHFIAIGSGHLAGPEGVVELLRAEGLEISGP